MKQRLEFTFTENYFICGLSGLPEWTYRREAPYQREARRRLVTPIYHAEASAQAEALATAAAGSQACKGKQGKCGGGGLRDNIYAQIRKSCIAAS